MNPYVRELATLLEQRFNIDRSDMTPTQWLMANTKLKGRPFSVDRYPFQRALIDDTSRNSVTIKPSQVGVSELYQRVALMLLARNRHRKGIYAYPDDDMRKKNVQTRVMPLVEAEKAFSPPGSEKWVRSIALMQIGTSFLYMTGSKVGDATSTDADFVFEDEYDLHDMEIAALFASRLQNSDWKIQRYFSTPTFTQFGVHALFEGSDQQSYLIKCDHCNHWQFPMFTQRFVHIPGLHEDLEDLTELTLEFSESRGLDLAGSYVRCEKCLSRLDLGREGNRAWVAKHPARQTMRGWKINPFSVATRPPFDLFVELFNYKTRGFIRGFKNSVLGEPEDSSNSRISEENIRMSMGSPSMPKIDKDVPTWIGCDMGHTCHLSLGQGEDEKNMRVSLEQVPLSKLRERIVEIQQTYNLVGGMVDRHPESQVAQDIWDLTGGVVVPGEYRGDKEMNLIMVPHNKEQVLYVQINRTLHLDQVDKAFRNKYIHLVGYGLLGEEIITQLRNMVRVEEPEQPAVWKKLNQNDHFFHSLGFLYSARKLRPYTELKVGPTLSMLGFTSVDMPKSMDGLLSRGTSGYGGLY